MLTLDEPHMKTDARVVGTTSKVLSVKGQSSQLRFTRLAKHHRRSSTSAKEVILLAEISWIMYQGGIVRVVYI